MVAAHMQRWTERQRVRRACPVPAQALLDLDAMEPSLANPWERALAHARAEIRALVEDGEIAHDQITTGWIAEWAADTMAG